MAAPSWHEISEFLRSHPNPIPDRRPRLQRLLADFISANENPQLSPNFQDGGTDRLDTLTRVMRDSAVIEDEALTLSLLKTLKILSRKHENRMVLGEAGVRAVVRFLHEARNPSIAGEGANVVLNVCYERENVEEVIRANGVQPLVGFLRSPEMELQANAAGAIQSICFQEKGRQTVREVGAIPDILNLLHEDRHIKVQTRAVGAIHNMSSDPESIRTIRKKDGIPRLIQLLPSEQAPICGSAAGALQNISREVASRKIIKDQGAIPLLGDLLCTQDMQAQVCAAGALLNIIGPELGEEVPGKGQKIPQTGNRRGFARIISCCIALGMAYDVVFDAQPQIAQWV